jgi:glutamyl-tRNA synthetase
MSRPVRVRFAPSPTGPLHLGGVRTALYNFLFARKHEGKFILRIEDTDQTRFVPGAEDYIMEALQWAEMVLDEGVREGGDFGPYRQSDRKHLYRQFADQLLASNHAYIAFDTPEELEDMRERLKAQGVPNPAYNHVTRQYMKNSLTLPQDEVEKRLADGEPYVVRIKVPRNEEIRFHDIIRGWVVFNSSQIDDKVIFKADGMPTYHMANVVDDYLMQITHVIRGEEWLPSTPIHVLLYKFLGLEEVMPEFAHLPLILKPDGNGKLSKRDGDRLGFPVFPLDWTNPETGEISIGFRERGFLPEAFMNMLAFLGWNPGTPQELFSKEELIEAFSLERVSKSGAKFDFEKAKWFNQQYIKQKSTADLLEELRSDILSHDINCPDDFMLKFIELFQDRVTYVKDFLKEGYYVFSKPERFDEEQFNKRWQKEAVQVATSKIREELARLESWAATEMEAVVKQIMSDAGLKPGEIMPVFRIMISGEAGGPPLFELAALIGKDEVLKRMDEVILKRNA